jgi:hypothetical protein
VVVSFVLAWFMREIPLRETGSLAEAVAESVPGDPLPDDAFEEHAPHVGLA